MTVTQGSDNGQGQQPEEHMKTLAPIVIAAVLTGCGQSPMEPQTVQIEPLGSGPGIDRPNVEQVRTR